MQGKQSVRGFVCVYTHTRPLRIALLRTRTHAQHIQAIEHMHTHNVPTIKQ